MSPDSAVEKVTEQRQQQATLGYEPSRYHIECPVCEERGILVSTRTRPTSGPLDCPGFTKHATEDGTVYHNDEGTS